MQKVMVLREESLSMRSGKPVRRSLLIILLILLGIIFSTACGCTTNRDDGNNTGVVSPAFETHTEEYAVEDKTPDTNLPTIVPAEIKGDLYEDRTFSVKFEKSEYELVLPVNLSVYYGAKNADKSITEGTLWNETDKVSAYYRSFFEGEAIDGFYDDILKKTRHIKIAEGFFR